MGLSDINSELSSVRILLEENFAALLDQVGKSDRLL